MSTWLTVGASLVSAVLGGLISPYLLQSRERRKARSAVFEILNGMRSVWWPEGFQNDAWVMPWGEVRKRAVELEAAAMVAGIPRQVVAPYIETLMDICKKPVWEEHHYGGYILLPEWDARLRDNLTALYRTLWHPWFGRIRYVWWPALRGRSTIDPVHLYDRVA